MFFDNYTEHADAMLNSALLWEYDMAHFDWAKMRNLVVQRVVERGEMDDYYAILNRYGIDGVRDAVVSCPTFNRKDKNFVCVIFNLKPEELRCSTHRQLTPKHWSC